MPRLLSVLAIASLIAGCTTTSPQLPVTEKQEVAEVFFLRNHKEGSLPRFGNSKLFLQIDGPWAVISEEYTNSEGKFEARKLYIKTTDLISYEIIENK